MAPSSPLARNGAGAQQRIDPLAFGAAAQQQDNGFSDAEGGADGSGNNERGAAASRQARPRNINNDEEAPPVTDETGERVREGFAEFLET